MSGKNKTVNPDDAVVNDILNALAEITSGATGMIWSGTHKTIGPFCALFKPGSKCYPLQPIQTQCLMEYRTRFFDFANQYESELDLDLSSTHLNFLRDLSTRWYVDTSMQPIVTAKECCQALTSIIQEILDAET